MTPEGKVKDECKKYLKSIGAWYFMPVSNGMGQMGIPDIICCYKGQFLAVETKAPGKIANVTANQERVLTAIQGADGWAIVVDNVEQLKNFVLAINSYQILEHGNATVNSTKIEVSKVLQRTP
jgi:hypothetical protein